MTGRGPETPAVVGGLLLAAAAGYTLALSGTSVPCRGAFQCRLTVAFGPGQTAGLVAVALAAGAFAVTVSREGWAGHSKEASGALATAAGAYVLFVARGTLGSALFEPFRPAVGAALLAAALLGVATYRGRDGTVR